MSRAVRDSEAAQAEPLLVIFIPPPGRCLPACSLSLLTALCSTKGFGGIKSEKPAEPESAFESVVTEEDRKWRLTPYDAAEWEVRQQGRGHPPPLSSCHQPLSLAPTFNLQEWVEGQKAFSNFKTMGTQLNCHMQVRTYGRESNIFVGLLAIGADFACIS